jgi:hypothetical protein
MRRGAGVAAAYTLLALVATWPLAAHLRTHLPAPSNPTTYDDTLLLGWVLSWDVHQLLRDPLHLYAANLFHPLCHALAYSEAMISEALLVLPLSPLTPDPTLLYNVTLLATFVLGATGTFLLVRDLGGSGPAAFVAGLVFAFAPYRFWQLDRLNALCVHLTPFLFLALHRWRDVADAAFQEEPLLCDLAPGARCRVVVGIVGPQRLGPHELEIGLAQHGGAPIPLAEGATDVHTVDVRAAGQGAR